MDSGSGNGASGPGGGADPESIAQIGALVRAERLRVILDLDLAANVPRTRRRWPAPRSATCPPGSIEAFEIVTALRHAITWR